jgi:hypothetical protein
LDSYIRIRLRIVIFWVLGFFLIGQIGVNILSILAFNIFKVVSMGIFVNILEVGYRRGGFFNSWGFRSLINIFWFQGCWVGLMGAFSSDGRELVGTLYNLGDRDRSFNFGDGSRGCRLRLSGMFPDTVLSFEEFAVLFIRT